MTELQEVDIDSPPGDHLGDYRAELGDPYPATREAHARQTELLPGETHRDPEEVRQDFARFGAVPWKLGTPARIVTPSDWAPNGYVLGSGVQQFRIAERDPHRARVVVTNYATGPVYLAPTPTRSVGFGSLFLPAADLAVGLTPSVTIRTTAEVWLFTLAGFTPGTEPVHVQVLLERYG